MNKDYRTISQLLEDDLKSLNEVRYTNIYNRIKGVKGLKRKDLDMISAIDPDILKKVVNSLDFLKDDVQEAVYNGGFEKGRGPTGISYSIPHGHPDAINPKTGMKYPDRQSRRYKKAYKDLLKKKAPKLLGMHPVREESISEASALDGINDIVKTKGAKKVNGVMVDMFTASMIKQVYDKVNDANKKKMEKANIQTLVQIAQKVMGMK